MAISFEERYARLNAAQREAVDSIEGPVMVMAGPGTGKTTILTLRIANILKKTDTPPSSILAITFTEAGVKAMRLKLREVIGTRADEVRIHTFHGFAASVIAEFTDHFPHLSRSRQLSDIDADSLVREILKGKKFAKLRPAGNPDLYVGSIIRTIADSKKEAWSPDMIRAFARGEIERIKSDESSISTRGASKGELKAEASKRIEKCEKTVLFADMYEAYEAKKKEESAIDFDDLIIELIIALERDELLLRLVQEKFLYILVDEHQDTNDSQNLLIRMVASFFENPNLFVVGDEKQAIYRFQGASVENFLALQKVWSRVKLISLKDNYRSHQAILDASFSMIENNYADGEHENLRIKLFSGSNEKPRPIDVFMAGNSFAAEKKLVENLGSIEKSGKTVAVIVRTNRDVEKILSLCRASGIDASAERGADIFAHPMGTIFFDLIEFLMDPSKVELLARTLSVGLWKLDFGRSAELVRDIRAGKISEIPRAIPAIPEINRALSKSGSVEFLIRAASASGFVDLIVRDPLSAEVWRGIVALSEDIAKRDSLNDPRALIEALLAYRASAEQKSVKVVAGLSSAKISIMTAHGSKGLEYDYVLIPYANEESWMPRARSSYFVLPREKNEGDEVRDTRRLFYVAITRARSHVQIFVPLADSLGRELTPLRFLSEIDPASVAKTELPSVLEMPGSKTIVGVESPKELVEYAKRSILEKGLSVTALNHFCSCPNLFFFKSILRVPEAPSASSEKGNAMHEAMARAWKLSDKSEKGVSNCIVDTVREYFSRSVLPAFEKEPLVEELALAAPKVAKALLGHLSSPGSILTETWMETSFSARAGGEEIECRLHGKLDAVLESDVHVSVFDYKTRDAMSVAAIRGETKSDDGGYFRQLVYYKMLASGNLKYKGKEIEPSLVFIKPDEKGKCPIVTIPVAESDIERVKGEVRQVIEKVWSGELFAPKCDDPDCQGCKLLEASRWE